MDELGWVKKGREGILHTVDWQICRGLTDDGLGVGGQGVFAVDLSLAAVGGGRAGPDIDVVFTAVEIGGYGGGREGV